MKVRTIVGARYAYACIQHGPRSIDVQLSAGHSVQTSLAASVLEMREQAAKILDRAAFIEAAIPFF